MHIPRVSIIILNWNGWRDTIECLESVYRVTYPNYDVIVVDNGSKDDSIRRIKEYAAGKVKVSSKFFEYNPNNKPIKVFEVNEEDAKQGKFNKPVYEKFDPNRRMILLKNKDNYGYAGGNNMGMKFALSVFNPEYVLLLNNDTVVDPNFLTELVKVAESDEKIGIVGPKIYYYDYNGRSDVINFTGAKLILWRGSEKRYRFKEIDKGQFNEKLVVDKIEGSGILFKQKLLSEVGLFDSSFFAYWEETDLCFRAKKQEYLIMSVLSSKIWHKAHSDHDHRENSTWFRVYLLNRNKWKFIKKNLRFLYLVTNMIYAFGIKLWIDILRHQDTNVILWYLLGDLDGLILNKNRTLRYLRIYQSE